MLSQKNQISYGVPQGSVLGPLLFLIYVNNLPDCVKNCEINMFADDTALFFTGRNESEIELKLNSDLVLISDYLEAYQLVINTIKIEFMMLGTPQKLVNIRQIQIYFGRNFDQTG